MLGGRACTSTCVRPHWVDTWQSYGIYPSATVHLWLQEGLNDDAFVSTNHTMLRVTGTMKLIQTALAAAVSSLLMTTAHAATPDSFPAPTTNRDTWFHAGQQTVIDNGKLVKDNRQAKNVILFVGDGMGISTITAARILQGQQPNIIGTGADKKASSGEENSLSFEKFPYLAHSKTYSANQQTPDSAPTMTAMVTGVKTNDGALSVDQDTTRGDCNMDPHVHSLKTILEVAEQRGKTTGLVSTARITHATPAANYAHTTERDWESDADIKTVGCGTPDIARQLIEMPYGDGIEVAFGGGRDRFLPATVTDPEDAGKTGKRLDGRNLTTEWTTKFGANSAFVYDQAGFDKIDPASATHVLGLFERSHMEYEADRSSDTGKEPSLAEMTEKAIKILQKNDKGFYLHVEGGRVDHGHHAGNAYRALTDAIALSDAVQKAVDTLKALNKLDETLIVVSADHSHTFTIGGYPQRGNNILGKVIEPGKTTPTLASDKNPYTTLSYANGFGYAVNVKGDDIYATPNVPHSGRVESMISVDTTDPNFHQEATVPLTSETHGGEDVAIFAMGPKAHLFQGTVEQNVIYHVMMNALRLK